MWAKVDDGWWCHPKVMGLDLASRGLWVSALSWSCAQRTDRIPAAFPTMVGGDEATAKQIEATGLWHGPGHDCPDCDEPKQGWIVHNWAEYQEKSLSEKRAEAGRKGGKASGASRRSTNQTGSKQEATDEAGTRPDPNPTQPETQGASADADDAPDDQAKTDEAFEQFWQAYPPTNGVMRDKKGAKKQWAKLSWDERRDAYRGAKNKAAHFEATGEEPPYALRFLRRRDFLDYQEPVTVDKATGRVRTIDTTPTCVHCQQAVDAHDDGMCDNGRAEAA